MEISKEDREMAMQAIRSTLDAHAFFQNLEYEVFEHNFKGYGSHPSTVRVHIFSKEDLKIVVFEDLGKGTSVTNASEQLATEVARLKKINPDPNKTVWLECYPYYGGNWDFDQITYKFTLALGLVKNEYIFSEPNWKPMRNEIVIKWLKAKMQWKIIK